MRPRVRSPHFKSISWSPPSFLGSSRRDTSPLTLSRLRPYSSSARSPRTVFSGIQPTGVPHIGNYLGALQNWVTLQEQASTDDTLLFCIVDWHAITMPQDPKTLRRQKSEMLASLLAIGLDPARCIMFCQSTVPEHAELNWILSTLAPLGTLNRMTQFKSKASLISRQNALVDSSSCAPADLDGLMLGLFAYPVLQAADILLYQTDQVPVGEDQSQHLELSRSLARSFNSKVSHPLFPIPETLLSPAKRLSDLRDPSKKMSKSALNEKGRISIIDDPPAIRKKIMSAVTDSESGITYTDNRPGIKNLINIYSAFSGQSVANVVQRFQDHTMRDFKEIVAKQVVDSLQPIRERYHSLEINTTHGQRNLQHIAEAGTLKARQIAQHTMAEVRSRMGLS